MAAAAAPAAAAPQALPSPPPSPPPDYDRGEIREALGDGYYEDTTVRNTIANEVISLSREQRARRLRDEEAQADVLYIDRIFKYGKSNPSEYGWLCAVAKLISFTAMFANEDPHELISEIARRTIDHSGLDAMEDIDKDEWSDLCSDKLECHAREIVEIIRLRFAHLRKLEVEHVVHWGDPDAKRILTEFARCVATRWRTSSVVSGTMYKTSKAIDTVRQANIEEIGYFRSVELKGGRLRPRNVPTSAEFIRHYGSTRYAD